MVTSTTGRLTSAAAVVTVAGLAVLLPAVHAADAGAPGKLTVGGCTTPRPTSGGRTRTPLSATGALPAADSRAPRTIMLSGALS